MKQTMLALMISVGLLAACNSNKSSSGSFGKRSSSVAKHTPVNRSDSSMVAINDTVTIKDSTKTQDSTNVKSTGLDSLLNTEEANAYTRNEVNYQGATGPGMGGSYASSSYRQNELNKKKYEKRALDKMKAREQFMKERAQAYQEMQIEDSLSTGQDSTYSMEKYIIDEY